jgi:hypothetical protein
MKKLLALATILLHIFTFSTMGYADGAIITDANGNVVSQTDGDITNVNVFGDQQYTCTNCDILDGQTLNINILNALGIADTEARAIFNIADGQASNWAGLLNLFGTAAFINTFGFNIAETFTGNVNGGALLSTLGISQEDFFSGMAELARIAGSDPAAIINSGQWNVADNSFLALVASAVQNHGVITANGGAAILAAGDEVTMDISGGSGLISVAINKSIDAAVYDKDGNKIADAISNTGEIRANGGLAILTAQAAEAAFDNVINHTGIIEANTVREEGGRIILDGGDEGVTAVTGDLYAIGDDVDEKGGSVKVLGEKVGVFGDAIIETSGYNGGGEVLIGGNYQGVGTERTADATYISADAIIKADAILEGDGGKIIVWSDNTTRAYGTFSAKGGSVSGNGGLVETSGKQFLDVDGARVDASAANGNAGTWLLDPRNVEVVAAITNGGGNQYGSFGANGGGPGDWYPNATGTLPSQVLNTQINGHLNAGTNVTISSYNATNVSNGNISVLAPISKTAGGDATLKFVDDPYTTNIQSILIDAAITSTAGKLNLYFSLGGALTFTANAIINTLGGSMIVVGAPSEITQQAGSQLNVGDLDINASGNIHLNQTANVFGTINADASFSVGGDINIADSGTPTRIYELRTGGTGGAANSINYNHTGSGDVTLTSGRVITAGGNITMDTSHALSIDAPSIIKTGDVGGGTVTVTGATVLTTPVADTGSVITLIGGAPDTIIDFTISGPVSQATNYIINATRDILGQATVTTTGGANVVMTADSDLDGLGGVWIESAGGINSSGDVTITGSAINAPGNGNGLSIFIEGDGK